MILHINQGIRTDQKTRAQRNPAEKLQTKDPIQLEGGPNLPMILSLFEIRELEN